jgi:hypothetical protein
LFDSASSRLDPIQSLVSTAERDLHLGKRTAKVIVRGWKVLFENGDSRMNCRFQVTQKCPEILGPVLKGRALRGQTKWI